MRDSTYRINLDVHRAEAQVELTAKQGEAARRIYATLMEDGKPWVQMLGNGVRAVMVGTLPDNRTIVNDCDLRSDGTVVYDFTAFFTEKTGLAKMQLNVYGDGALLASPKFLVDIRSTAYDTGQLFGDEIRDVVNEAYKRVESAVVTYGTAAEMLSAGLKAGQMAATRGRWNENDGGARTYIVTELSGATLSDGITLNPLALPLSGGYLYAVPVIDDMVTVLDIGLERGRLRRSDLPAGQDEGDYADLHERDNGGISAENSAKLQRYLDAIPESGSVNFSSGKASMNRIFFPNGHWYFRDPVVVRKPVSFIGTRLNAAIEPVRSGEGKRYESSNIVFLATEYVCSSGTQSASACPYIGDGCVVAEQTNAAKLGDENYDATATPVVRESAYFDHALFYVAANNVAFRGLEFSARRQEKDIFFHQSHPKNAVGPGLGDRDTGWKPKGGRPWNPFTVRRKLKGVCAVIVRDPIQDTGGKILVKPTFSGGDIVSVSVKYKTNVGADTPKYCKIDGCRFYGFSGSAVVAGRLSYLTDSIFYKNYISYTASTDNFIYKSWFGNGFVGLVTNGHSVLQSDGMYIDMMAGFGVMTNMTRFTFKKKTVKYVRNYDPETDTWPVGTRGDGGEGNVVSNNKGEPFYFCEHSLPIAAGRLTGHFNCVVDCCVMGAYFAYESFMGAAIGGLVKRCGFLYNRDVRIVNKNDFLRQSNFNKAKKYYDNLDAIQATYNGAAPYHWNGSDWVEHTELTAALPSITDYLNSDFGASANVVKAYKYIKSYKSGSEAPTTCVWDTATGEWVAPEPTGETRQTLSSFLALPKTYSHNLRYVEWLKAGEDGIRLEPSVDSYYDTVTGDNEYVDTDVLEDLIEERVRARVAQYNSEHGTEYSFEELLEMGEVADSIFDDMRAYVLDHWNELAPAEYRTSVKALIAKDRTDNFYKLIGTAAINVCLAKSITFSGQMLAKAFARSHTAAAGTWEATPNAMPIFGFNFRSAQSCNIRGFNRVPYANQDGKNHGGVMIPAIMQYSTKNVMIEAPTVESEDAVFNVKTNNNAENADDRRYLSVTLSHDAFGKPTCYVYGSVYLAEDTIVNTSNTTPKDGATALDNTKLFSYEPYPLFYNGNKPNVIGVPLFGLGSTNKGKPVGLLTINFQAKTVYLYGFADFDGTVLPVFN